MQAVSTLVQQGARPHPEAQGVSPAVKNLFLMLQGSYGTPFLSKYSTGVKDGDGRDLGIRASMKVWESRLGKFPADVLMTAFNRVIVDSPEFPPSLPQIEKACDAAMPRQTYAQEQGLPALPPPEKPAPVSVSIQKRDDGKDWARRIMARVAGGDMSLSRYARESAEVALGKRARMSA